MSTWTALEGSVRGAAHEQTQLPNQDAVATQVLNGGRLVIAALADGHGGERYVRSDVGSRLAVEIACEVLAQRLAGVVATGLTRRRSAALGRELHDEIVPAMVGEWRRRVAADLAARPFTDDERSRTTASLDDDPVIAYGATLLVAVVAERVIVLAQLGDGDILVMRRGDVLLPIEPDTRLVASQTTSLCLETAAADFRCRGARRRRRCGARAAQQRRLRQLVRRRRLEHTVGPDLRSASASSAFRAWSVSSPTGSRLPRRPVATTRP